MGARGRAHPCMGQRSRGWLPRLVRSPCRCDLVIDTVLPDTGRRPVGHPGISSSRPRCGGGTRSGHVAACATAAYYPQVSARTQPVPKARYQHPPVSMPSVAACDATRSHQLTNHQLVPAPTRVHAQRCLGLLEAREVLHRLHNQLRGPGHGVGRNGGACAERGRRPGRAGRGVKGLRCVPKY